MNGYTTVAEYIAALQALNMPDARVVKPVGGDFDGFQDVDSPKAIAAVIDYYPENHLNGPHEELDSTSILGRKGKEPEKVVVIE